MRKITLTLITATLAFTLFAQTEEDNTNTPPKTEFVGGNGGKVSGFGGPMFQLAFINGEAIPFIGGGGAGLFNDNFYFGGFGMGTATEIQIENINPLVNGLTPVGRLEMGFGGLMMGYMPMGHKKFHPLIGLDFAWGGYEVYELNADNVILDGTLTAVTPRIGAEANALPWLKVNLGVGYRSVFGSKSTFFNLSDLNSPLLDLRLQFGWFAD